MDKIPFGLIFIVYTDEEKTPRTQFDEKHIYMQKYEGRKHKARKKNLKYLE